MKKYIDFAKTVKGFLNVEEGKTLYNITMEASKLGPCLEIGSYCGKSSIYIGAACKERSTVLFSIDHHKGSSEQQPGEEYFDVKLFDYKSFTVNSLDLFRTNILKMKLENIIIPIISNSNIVAKVWKIELSMVFIDGSHSYIDVLTDYECWHNHIIPGGYLVFHDVFRNRNEGGQAPYKVYKLAIKSGLFVEHEIVKTLGILKRKK